jgi:hypothetical protein
MTRRTRHIHFSFSPSSSKLAPTFPARSLGPFVHRRCGSPLPTEICASVCSCLQLFQRADRPSSVHTAMLSLQGVKAKLKDDANKNKKGPTSARDATRHHPPPRPPPVPVLVRRPTHWATTARELAPESEPQRSATSTMQQQQQQPRTPSASGNWGKERGIIPAPQPRTSALFFFSFSQHRKHAITRAKA